MRARELLRFCFGAFHAHKMRSFLTALGIVISVWMIVSVMSVISGLNAFVLGRVVTLSPDVFAVTRFGIITSRDEFLQAMKRKGITREEAAEVRRLCESCGEIGAEIANQLDVHAGSRRIAGVPISGTTANIATLRNLDLEAGRYFTENEDEHRAPVAVIGSEIRDELYPRLDPIGRPIWIGGVPHTVIGLLARQGSFLSNDPDLVVYTPFRAAELRVGKNFAFSGNINLLVRTAGGPTVVDHCEQEVMQIFRWLRHTPIQNSNPVGVVTAEMVQELFNKVSWSTFAFVSVISLMSLVVGAIVVANIMLVSVVQRTREIGLRMALGARKRDVRRQFLIEAVILSLAGGAVGLLFGWATAEAINRQSPFPALIETGIVVKAMGLAALTGVAAGFFPARKAANLTPIEALRHD